MNLNSAISLFTFSSVFRLSNKNLIDVELPDAAPISRRGYSGTTRSIKKYLERKWRALTTSLLMNLNDGANSPRERLSHYRKIIYIDTSRINCH